MYKKRLVVYHHNEHGDEQWGNVTRSGRGAMCIATITRPLSQVNVADMNGYIYFYRWFRIYRWFFRKEIYAGGGKGDLWQFNGETWRQVFFSSDMPLESVCCGQDGFVYIGAQCGTVFKGRNDE
ncbi:MAG: hypothetical protein J6571_00150 [Snodgrassella sp.]|uniref:hypothetical protein n=2 Tax=Snodgrassella sp. TaxID=2815304 RepID=UPI00258E079F|nr:hypothetical protein [Snodgrassella sp.]MCO6521591.1 hypothetical protein [Snodgrassella sp.]